MQTVGRLLILVGAVILLVGVVLAVFGRLPLLGRLPGDLVFRRDGLIVGPPPFAFSGLLRHDAIHGSPNYLRDYVK